jgi:CobQ-like glutamine amidotransferase family enzyme
LYTEAGQKRFIGNTVIYNEEYDETYVGFENHSGKTYIGSLKPLGKVVAGYGNNDEDGYEGCIYKNTYCTYFHGSLLSKNPELADRLILKALESKYEHIELTSLDDSFENKAKEFIINREKNSRDLLCYFLLHFFLHGNSQVKIFNRLINL